MIDSNKDKEMLDSVIESLYQKASRVPTKKKTYDWEYYYKLAFPEDPIYEYFKDKNLLLKKEVSHWIKGD